MKRKLNPEEESIVVKQLNNYNEQKQYNEYLLKFHEFNLQKTPEIVLFEFNANQQRSKQFISAINQELEFASKQIEILLDQLKNGVEPKNQGDETNGINCKPATDTRE